MMHLKNGIYNLVINCERAIVYIFEIKGDEEKMSKRKSMGIQHSMCVQPVFLIGTYDEDGNVNFAPITWVSVTWDTDNFMLVISMFGSKKTKLNVIKTKQLCFVKGK